VTLLAVIVVDAALVVALPLTLQRIIDDGVLAGDVTMVVLLSLVALAVVLLSGGSQVVILWLSSRLGHAVGYRLRNDAFAHAQRFPVGFCTNQHSGC
jgi:ATP-binding cassette, subfamily B, bacterial